MKKINQTGFSIIEVMTSIVVALIGVLGVMILIPFAIRQAQTSLDIESAAVLGRNAWEEFQISGFRDPNRWLILENRFGPASDLIKVDPSLVPIDRAYSIDPLGINGQPGTSLSQQSYINASFPFNLDALSRVYYPDGSNNPLDYRIESANLTKPIDEPFGIRQFTAGDAKRLFLLGDDLVFEEAISSSATDNDAIFNGPTQVFDVFPGPGIPLRRQAVRRFSWSAIAVPRDNRVPPTPPNPPLAPSPSPKSFDLYLLVYKDREFNPILVDGIPPNLKNSPHMRAAEVISHGSGSPIGTIRIASDQSFPEGVVGTDDWVMLINRRILDGAWQLGFYRVINFRKSDPTSVGADTFTLDGKDFFFGPGTGPTFMVYLNKVISVYTHSVNPERDSVWKPNNFSFE